MIRLTQIYKGTDRFREALRANGISPHSICFVRILTSCMDEGQALRLAGSIRSILPNSTIVGATSAQAVIFNGDQFQDETLLILEMYDTLTIRTAVFSWEGKSPAHLAREVHGAFSHGAENGGLTHILFSHRYPHIHQFVQEMNSLQPLLALAGGIAGDQTATDLPGFVFTDKGIVRQGAVAFAAVGKTGYHFQRVSTSIEGISPYFTITEMEGSLVKGIENKPALHWLYQYLDIPSDRKLSLSDWKELANNDYLVHFPLLLEDGSGRFTRYNSESDSLSLYFSTLEKGARFRVGYVNPAKTVKECYQLCDDILDTPVEYLFVYTCLFRKLYLQNCAEWELTPFDKYNVCGMFMMGEIACLEGKNRFYNGACAMVGIAENEKYLIPDTLALEKWTTIKDDIDFYEKARAMGRADGTPAGSSLLGRLSEYRFEEDAGRYIDADLGIPNFYQFQEDRSRLCYDKLCLVEIQTADASIAFLGQEQYYAGSRDILQSVIRTMEANGMNGRICLYVLNYKAFILSAGGNVSETEFLAGMKTLHEKFEYVTTEGSNMTGVARFVVVINQEALLESAMSVLLESRGLQENFLVSRDGSFSAAEDFLVIDLLKYAIDQNKIIPYYQGIYDNRAGRITKYEALMRIQGRDGAIYPPAVFMDIAKKYKFYPKISQMMIQRVLEEFAGRRECVSFNISYHDIQSSSFRRWFFSRLRQYPCPSQLVVEFVETESYQSPDIIFEFIEEVRGLGARIAIDDFGSGYSTLSVLVALKPNFIKVDGSIIQGALCNKDNLVLLDTISYLAKQMNAETVAEYVENAEIQEIVKAHGISYSQGYYFSQPRPLSQTEGEG